MKIYKRLFIYIKPYWKQLVCGVLCTIVVSAVDGAIAWAVKPIFDDMFIKKDPFMLKFIPVMIVGLFLIKGIFRFTSGYLMNYTGHRIVMDLRNALFKHTQTLSVNFFSENRVGGLLSKIVNDVSAIQGMVSIAIKDIIREFFSVVVLTGVLFYRDWQLAMVSFFLLPSSTYFMAKVGRKLRYLGKRGQEKIADISSLLVEYFSGARVIKAFRREELIIEKFEKENNNFFTIMKRTIKYREFTAPFMELIGAMGLACIVWYGGKRIYDGSMTVGSFSSFITALLMLTSPVRRLSDINNTLQQASASANRIFELFDTKTDIKEKKDAVSLKPFSKNIQFDHVSFSYDSSQDMVLHEITLEAKKGEIIAIVGMSGVGKSTLLNLLPRFYDATAGKITIDGVNVTDATLNSLRSMIGIVTQDVFLFNDTIRNNIAFGDPDAPDDIIIDAAKQAYADQFIMNMPLQYETIIGERGIKLSGGEKQRIAIARALVKNASIMILDEATSALDTESEQMVQEALNNLMKNRTTFVIAHRLSTILNADKIIVLENGRIVETGNHTELLEQSGYYKKIFEMQFMVASC